MKRRDALKGIVLFSIGTGVIFSCTDKYQAIRDLQLNYLKPEDNELDILDEMSRLIVPLKSIPELAEHTALPFILTMVDDIYPPKERDAFQAGFKALDTTVNTMAGKPFSKMNEEEKTGILQRLNSNEEGMDIGLKKVFDIVKGESLRYLQTSELYQRKVNYYEMAPGRFKGDVLISELKNANTI